VEHAFDVRTATPAHIPAIQALSVATGLLSIDEAAELLAIAPEGDSAAAWLVAVDVLGAVVGAACCAREPVSDRVWNLHLLAVDPSRQGRGVGTRLLAQLEARLAGRTDDPGSSLLIETSSTESFAPIRAFYTRRGYVQVGQVPSYYGPEDDKVVLWKSLSGRERAVG
jgi:GNAT superfamily N-acetyltransferase